MVTASAEGPKNINVLSSFFSSLQMLNNPHNIPEKYPYPYCPEGKTEGDKESLVMK